MLDGAGVRPWSRKEGRVDGDGERSPKPAQRTLTTSEQPDRLGPTEGPGLAVGPGSSGRSVEDFRASEGRFFLFNVAVDGGQAI